MSEMNLPSAASPDQRKAALAQSISREVAAGGWRVESQSDYQAVLVKGKNTNHLLHLILTLITVFLWTPVWVVVTVLNQRKTVILTVDDYGNVLQQR
ncbi:hypothetical protein [Jongsikchunia kroppenstedtii]|uniref:hypothetical protein n=1 Tax=Jongsikchunia kroppenstedtii TaxID=1121721 RepID=UPI0012DF22A4|nr:hypothetical protein [Jongsikchunia kroppenstedtii]